MNKCHDSELRWGGDFRRGGGVGTNHVIRICGAVSSTTPCCGGVGKVESGVLHDAELRWGGQSVTGVT